jgi:hypothetical protein
MWGGQRGRGAGHDAGGSGGQDHAAKQFGKPVAAGAEADTETAGQGERRVTEPTGERRHDEKSWAADGCGEGRKLRCTPESGRKWGGRRHRRAFSVAGGYRVKVNLRGGTKSGPVRGEHAWREAGSTGRSGRRTSTKRSHGARSGSHRAEPKASEREARMRGEKRELRGGAESRRARGEDAGGEARVTGQDGAEGGQAWGEDAGGEARVSGWDGTGVAGWGGKLAGVGRVGVRGGAGLGRGWAEWAGGVGRARVSRGGGGRCRRRRGGGRGLSW